MRIVSKQLFSTSIVYSVLRRTSHVRTIRGIGGNFVLTSYWITPVLSLQSASVGLARIMFLLLESTAILPGRVQVPGLP